MILALQNNGNPCGGRNSIHALVWKLHSPLRSCKPTVGTRDLTGENAFGGSGRFMNRPDLQEPSFDANRITASGNAFR